MENLDLDAIRSSRKADFALNFIEGYEPGKSLRCWRIRQFSVGDQPDYLMVTTDESMDRKMYGLPDSETNLIILAPRYCDDSLFQPAECPKFVNVLFPVISISRVGEVIRDGSIQVDDTYFVAIAETQPSTGGSEKAHIGILRHLPKRTP
jgi:hypothetical protein